MQSDSINAKLYFFIFLLVDTFCCWYILKVTRCNIYIYIYVLNLSNFFFAQYLYDRKPDLVALNVCYYQFKLL